MWKWTNKKIALVAILIAASVSFVIIGSRLAAITTFPSFKIAFAGLPVKITGYLFGPLIGAITGVVSDLLSFAMLPSYYHFLYTLIMAVSGFVPGVVAWIMIKKQRSINTHYFAGMLTLTVITVSLFCTLQFVGDEAFFESIKSPIHKKWLFQLIVCSGYVVLSFILTFFRFYKKGANIKYVAPVIIMISILEVHNSLITPLADHQSLNVSYGAAWIGHLIASPIKLATNLTVISITIKIVEPLVQNRLDDSY